VAESAPVRVVGVTGVEGAGPDLATRFPADRVTVLDLEAFPNAVADVVQLDWGDFLLARSAAELSGVTYATPFQVLLLRTFATIRAVDDTCWYVHTRDEAAARRATRAHREPSSGGISSTSSTSRNSAPRGSLGRRRARTQRRAPAQRRG
jgi:hypothetical protein